jgi:hypothetical protein
MLPFGLQQRGQSVLVRYLPVYNCTRRKMELGLSASQNAQANLSPLGKTENGSALRS